MHYTTAPTQSFRFQYIDGVESLEDYRPGGYHPVQIDKRLHQRYRVVHKLGHGTFSTAWLALDEWTSKYVVVKVGTADANTREANILSELAAGIPPVAPGSEGENVVEKAPLLPLPLDRFYIKGPNGTHPCFVTAPARCSAMDAKEASGPRLFQLDVARATAAQLTMAVSYVHSKGYVHGDLHLGNVLLELPSSLNNLSIEQLYAKFGAPEKEPVVRLKDQSPLGPGVPPYVVPPLWLGIASDKITVDEAKILLGDFGVAFRPSEEPRFQSQAPLVIRPPEAFFEPTVSLSFGSDIWSLGCTLFELLAHRSLIDGILAPQDEITAQQVHLQGRLPPEWWEKWEERPKWFDEQGNALSNPRDVWSWDRRFDQWIQEPRQSIGMEKIGDEERLALLQMLRWRLSWRPRERPSVDQVLGTAWMTRWALPAYDRSRKGWARGA
ncbi:hypothetical protein VTK73DRAFT_7190 [Phialemonium thermophilum]|uniref:Protein kinase domain-containing protein n=1 Tax=Phialemonium thermophilum TaxID=223376 RepID=A0ABR3WG59_9PEZI